MYNDLVPSPALHQRPLAFLAVPIFFEFLLIILSGLADVALLSGVSDAAVAGAGAVNTVFMFLVVFLALLAQSAVILVTRLLGAKADPERLAQVQGASFMILAVSGAILSAAGLLGGGALAQFLGLVGEARTHAETYARIVGASFFFVGVRSYYSAILAAHGHPRLSLQSSALMIVVQITAGSSLLFGWLGLPKLGVVGIATAALLARAAGAAFLAGAARRAVDLRLAFVMPPAAFRAHARSLLSLAVPTMLEPATFHFVQILMTALIVVWGSPSLAARSYVTSLLAILGIVGFALSRAVQIAVGQGLGARDEQAVKMRVAESLRIGLVVIAGGTLLLVVSSRYVLGLFTNDPDILSLCRKLLIISIILEPAKAVNFILCAVLRTSGDVHFPVLINVSCMVFVSLGLGLLFSWHWGYGLVGLWAAMALDETVRAAAMAWRWRVLSVGALPTDDAVVVR